MKLFRKINEMLDASSLEDSFNEQIEHLYACIELFKKNDHEKAVVTEKAITPMVIKMSEQFVALIMSLTSSNVDQIRTLLRDSLLTDYRAERAALINAFPADALKGDLRREVADTTNKMYENFKDMKNVLHKHLDDLVVVADQPERPRSCVIVL